MIIEKYADGVRNLSAGALSVVVGELAKRRPIMAAHVASGSDLVDWCREHNVSQSELVVCVSRNNDPEGVEALETLIGHPIDRTTPAQAYAMRAGSASPDPDAPKRPRGSMSGRPSGAATDDRIIRLLVDKNPKREGTSAHVRFSRYSDGMTIAAFVALGGQMADVKWDEDKGFIRVEAAARSAA